MIPAEDWAEDAIGHDIDMLVKHDSREKFIGYVRAIQADALEAAARKCRAIANEHEPYHDDAATNAFEDACDDCAESISALLLPPQEKP